MRKTSDKSKLKSILWNTWPVLSKTIKVIKNKESLKNYHNQGDEMDRILDGILEQKWDVR